MNIFVTSFDPEEAAGHLDDKRLVKMTLETAQILSTVMRGPYRPTHIHHPCVVWAKTEGFAMNWLTSYLRSLCNEYTCRYRKIHACMNLWENFNALYPEIQEKPKQWMLCPPTIKILDPRPHYHNILNGKWLNDKRPPRWTNRTPPDFWHFT